MVEAVCAGRTVSGKEGGQLSAQGTRHQSGRAPAGLTWGVLSAGFFITAWRKLLST